MKKGQIAIEFLIIMGFATLILVSYLWLAGYLTSQSSQEAMRTSAQSIALDVQQHILTASSVRDGYRSSFFLPGETEQGVVVVTNGTQDVTVVVGSQNAVVNTPDYQGFFQPGENNITKQSGVVRIN